jgi:hypothetical protein
MTIAVSPTLLFLRCAADSVRGPPVPACRQEGAAVRVTPRDAGPGLRCGPAWIRIAAVPVDRGHRARFAVIGGITCLRPSLLVRRGGGGERCRTSVRAGMVPHRVGSGQVGSGRDRGRATGFATGPGWRGHGRGRWPGGGKATMIAPNSVRDPAGSAQTGPTRAGSANRCVIGVNRMLSGIVEHSPTGPHVPAPGHSRLRFFYSAGCAECQVSRAYGVLAGETWRGKECGRVRAGGPGRADAGRTGCVSAQHRHHRRRGPGASGLRTPPRKGSSPLLDGTRAPDREESDGPGHGHRASAPPPGRNAGEWCGRSGRPEHFQRPGGIASSAAGPAP